MHAGSQVCFAWRFGAQREQVLTGVCMQRFRKGLSSSFILRCAVPGGGNAEMRFFLSPPAQVGFCVVLGAGAACQAVLFACFVGQGCSHKGRVLGGCRVVLGGCLLA